MFSLTLKRTRGLNICPYTQYIRASPTLEITSYISHVYIALFSWWVVFSYPCFRFSPKYWDFDIKGLFLEPIAWSMNKAHHLSNVVWILIVDIKIYSYLALMIKVQHVCVHVHPSLPRHSSCVFVLKFLTTKRFLIDFKIIKCWIFLERITFDIISWNRKYVTPIHDFLCLDKSNLGILDA